MVGKMTAAEMLDSEYLEIRCRILGIASSLDRIDYAERSRAIQSDTRLVKLHQAMRILSDGQPDRARRVQMAFSDPFDPQWHQADSSSER